MSKRILASVLIGSWATAAVSADDVVLMAGQQFTEPEAAVKLERFAGQYHDLAGWKARAENLRHGVRQGLKLDRLPPASPLNPIRRGLWRGEGYTVENVAIETLPGFWSTGNLYLPVELAAGKKIPGVLCPHGHTADCRLLEATQTRCAVLAKMGAAVFAWDMVGFGESAPVEHEHPQSARLQTYNSMRAVDFLSSLGFVDEDRLAVTGESGGGTQSFLLACVDDRIDVSAPVVQVSAHFYGGCVCESGMPIHKSADHETDNVEIAASFAPKPQLIVSDGGDWTRNVPRVELPYIQRVYQLYGAENELENAHFADEGHDYGPSKRKAVYRFFAKHLQLDLTPILDASGEVDESFVKVRSIEDLKVFPPDSPRPERALKTAQEVFAELDRKAP